ncbi:hypothetical protein [Arcobacter sp. FWKO B]|uniref:hypothetical protein n=1 Tax=Arcobacter sp. FWKO B TaxID=2593672 RepID=UPI0018A4BFED|nr:hypothetical protein [Arcobacter sp. FWKO B]QOG13059.1 hypothetical protein FWKOB_10335 [Arcobacter sp. FWKO B]
MKRNIIFVLLILLSFVGCTKSIDTIKVQPTTVPVEYKVTKIQEHESKEIEVEEVFNEVIIKSPIEETLPLTMIKKEKIALVFPSKIVGRYGNDALNTIMAYSLFRNIDFEIKVYDSQFESYNHISNIFKKIEQDGFKKVIAIFSQNDTVLNISNLNSFQIYIPTLLRQNSPLKVNNITYGAINYSEQFNHLMKFAQGGYTEIFDNESISSILYANLQNKSINLRSKQFISQQTTNYKPLFENNRTINNSTLFLNTTVLQSSIILSQLRVYEINPFVVLSTQINYNPMILSLSQFEDRKSMLIANSIGYVDPKLKAIAETLRSDLEYNWVNFSTIVGIESLLFNNQKKYSKGYDIRDNQVYYETTVYRPASYSFIKVEQMQPVFLRETN